MEVFEYFNIAGTQKRLDVLMKLRNDKSECALLEHQQRAGMPWQSVAGIVAGAAVSTLTDRQCERITYCMCYPEEKKRTNERLFTNYFITI